LENEIPGFSPHFVKEDFKRCRIPLAGGVGVSPTFLWLPQDWGSQRGLKEDY